MQRKDSLMWLFRYLFVFNTLTGETIEMVIQVIPEELLKTPEL